MPFIVYTDTGIYCRTVGGNKVIIVFASKNHMGLNSDLGRNISDSEYFTVVETENAKIKKVTNVENDFFGLKSSDADKIAEFIKELSAEKLIVGEIDKEAKDKLASNNIEVIQGYEGRIADMVFKFQ